MNDYYRQIIRDSYKRVLLENAPLADRAYDLFCKQEQGRWIQETFLKRLENQLRQEYNFDYIILLSDDPQNEFYKLFNKSIPVILKKYIEQQTLKEIQDDFQ